MSKKPFPMGVVVTLSILWLGLVGAVAWGWFALRPLFDDGGRPAAVMTSPAPTASTVASAVAPGETRAAAGPRVTWTQDGLWRFAMKAGGAALAALVFLLLAVGAGLLVQEKAESVDE